MVGRIYRSPVVGSTFLAASRPLDVDAASAVRGSYELLVDICHFRRDRDGQDRLVGLFADAIRANLDEWLDASSGKAAPGPALVRRATAGLEQQDNE